MSGAGRGKVLPCAVFCGALCDTARRALRSLCALLPLALLTACGATGPSWEPTWDAPWASFEVREQAVLLRSRLAMEDGRHLIAWRELDGLVQQDPRNLEAAMLRQDVELSWLADPAAPTRPGDAELAALFDSADPLDGLRRLYLERARSEATPASLVLAARMESDALAAVNLLDQAIALAPDCAPAHAGRAHALLLASATSLGAPDAWNEALRSLERSLELDPGSPRARRLEAWMLAQAGSSAEAGQGLEVWLRNTRLDPRVGDAERVPMELDLARTRILARDEKRALRELQRLAPLDGELEARRLSLVACANEGLGRGEAALEAARAAEAAGGLGLLPLVQQGQILQDELSDPGKALVIWEQVVEQSEERGDLASLLQSVRARVLQERAEERKRKAARREERQEGRREEQQAGPQRTGPQETGPQRGEQGP